MPNPPISLPGAVARAWCAETRMGSAPSAARKLANSVRRRKPRAANGARAKPAAPLPLTRGDSRWLQAQADYLATTRPVVAAVLVRAFMDSCHLVPADTAPLIAKWIRRRERRTRRIKYPAMQSVRAATVADLDAIAAAFDLPGRGAAFGLIVYVLRNLDGVPITDDA